MKTLATVIKGFQSMKATRTDEHLPMLRVILAPITADTGITELHLSGATAHQISLFCHLHGVLWRVRLLPTFHGLEVKIDGKDFNGSKALISRTFRKAFPFNEPIGKQQGDYLANCGSKCPHCGSTHIEATRCAEADGNTASAEIICNDCDSTWTDQYILTGFSDLYSPQLLKACA